MGKQGLMEKQDSILYFQKDENIYKAGFHTLFSARSKVTHLLDIIIIQSSIFVNHKLYLKS